MRYMLPLVAVGCLLTQFAVADSAPSNDQFKIYTENFAIAQGDSPYSHIHSVNVPIIGKVGSLSIIEGKKPDGIVAYVFQNEKEGYLIRDTILVRCHTNINCVPAEYNANRLGTTNLYQYTVKNYEQWQETITKLENMDNVLDVAPSFEHGLAYTSK